MTTPAVQLRVVGTTFLRQRPIVTIPVMLAALGLFVAGGAPRGQVIALAVGLSLVQTMFLVERFVGARRPLSRRALARSRVVTAVGIAMGGALPGGRASPIVPLRPRDRDRGARARR
jgi:hypothetical protein